MTRLAFPTRGVSDQTPFIEQPGDTAPPGALRNVRLRAAGKDRAQVGPREGLERAFGQTLSGAVQCLGVVDRASGLVDTLGTATPITTGTSRLSLPLKGQAWFLDQDLSMFGQFHDVAAGSNGAFVVDWHPNGQLAAVGTILGLSGPTRTVSRISILNPDNGGIFWQANIEDMEPGGAVGVSPRPMIVNRVLVDWTYTYVLVDRYIYVLRTADGVYLSRFDVSGWAWQTEDIRIRPDGRVAVLYRGNPNVSGPVTSIASVQGAYFRAGVALLVPTGNTNPGDQCLSYVQFGPKKADTYAFYENHPTWRFSEQSASSPRGFLPFAMAVDATGNLFVGGTNQGFGPGVLHPPDGSTIYRTVTKISPGDAAAALVWERDTDSIRVDWQSTGWYNDIPITATGADIGSPPAGPEPSVNALACDNAGNVYAAGKLNAPTGAMNLFRLRGSTGDIEWRQNLGGMIYQHALAYDPVSRLLVAVGQRNNAWAGAAGQAHLWRIDPESGSIVDSVDLGKSVSAFGVAVSATGRIAYVTSYVG